MSGSQSNILSRQVGRITLLTLLAVAMLYLPISFPWRLPILAAIAIIVVRAETGSLNAIGLGRRRVGPTLTLGVSLAFAAAGLVGEVIQPLLERATGTSTDYSLYGPLVGNLQAALTLILYAMISAAIGEEILMRGFVLHQLSALLGDSRIGRWSAILLGALWFGLLHHQQNAVGIIATGLIGILFGWSFFASGRNLWALMLAHALTDIYGVMMIYAGRYS